MKYFFSLFAISLLLMLVGCSDTGDDISTLAPNQDESPNLSKEFVPFNGSMDGLVNLGGSVSCDPGWTTLNFEAQGEVLHCGTSTIYGENCSQATSQQGGEIENGFATITAANGDKIDIAYYGTYVFDTYPPTMGTFSLTGTIVGGTGRFDGAAGSINVEAVQHFTGFPDPITLTWTGTIEY